MSINTTSPSLEQRLAHVCERINQARASAASDAAVRLVAVSKRHSHEAIREAHGLGQRDFGENYLQEALEKIEQLGSLPIIWHFIGPIQSNKTRAIAENFRWVHTLERRKIAERLSQQRDSTGEPLQVCIQVNIDNEASKAGLVPDEVADFAQYVHELPNLTLRGLMAIPQKNNETGDAFTRMQALFRHVGQCIHSPHWDTLSMGMSNDLELAIANGANMVRIGTDIFGTRPSTSK